MTVKQLRLVLVAFALLALGACAAGGSVYVGGDGGAHEQPR